MANRTGSRKIIKISLSILGISLLLILIGLFALPTIISTQWVGSKVKQTVNAKIPGTIDFQSLSLSWFNGVKIQDILYADHGAGLRLKISDINTTKGLLELAKNYKDIGTVTIENPVVYVTPKDRPKPADINASDSANKQGESISTTIDEEKDSSPTSIKQQETATLPIIAGTLDIKGGEVFAVLPDAVETQLINNLGLQVQISDQNNTLEYKVKFKSGDGKGWVNGAGNFILPSGNLATLEGVAIEATIDLSNWQLADQLSILTTISDIPKGGGLLSGHLGVAGTIKGGIDFSGNLSAENVHLSGGPLQTDNPSFDKISIEFDAQKTGSAFTIRQVALHSPLATGEASGVIDVNNSKTITGKLSINLAQLFAQFPATLKLNEGTKISKGQIDLNAQVNLDQSTTTFDTKASLDQLEGIAGNKKISLDKSVTLLTKGENSPAGLKLENLAIQSSFLNGQGQGDINKMQVAASADIGAALKEIKKFINVKEWESTGKLDLNLEVNTTSASLRAVAGKVAIKDFVLKQKGRVIAPRSEVKTNLATTLRVDSELRPIEMVETSFDFQTWLGHGAVSIKNLAPPSNSTSVQISDLQFKGNVELSHLTNLLHTVDALPKDNRLAGQVNIDTHLSMKDQKLDLDETKVVVNNLLFTKAKQKANEKKIQITTRGKVDLEAKAAIFNSLDVTTTAGQITFTELLVNDWSKPKDSIKSIGTIDLDLGLLTKSLGDFLNLPPKTDIAGKAAIKIKVDLTSKENQVAQLDTTLSNLKIGIPDKPPIQEESIQLGLDLSGDLEEQNITLSKLDIISGPISLSTKGTIGPDKNERLLNTEGFITLNLKTISGYLKSIANLDLEMVGAEKKPFTFQLQSTDRQWVNFPKKTALSAAFHAESIKGFGLFIESLDIPIKLAKGRGNLSILGNVNKGKLSISPIFDFTVEQPVVSVPENSEILTNVGLTDDLSKDLLVHINPIFQGAAVSRGTVDLTMKNLNWPLDTAARKDGTFAGTLVFNEVKLKAGGLLEPLLAVMKVEGREIVLGDQPMEFVAEDEMVHCSTLSITVNEHSLLLSGAIGFDQSLDYVAQIPVTKKMVSGDVYKYLKGTFISVPIGGTVSKPVINKNVVQVALKDLILQAGKKQVADQAGKLLQNLLK